MSPLQRCGRIRTGFWFIDRNSLFSFTREGTNRGEGTILFNNTRFWRVQGNNYERIVETVYAFRRRTNSPAQGKFRKPRRAERGKFVPFELFIASCVLFDWLFYSNGLVIRASNSSLNCHLLAGTGFERLWRNCKYLYSFALNNTRMENFCQTNWIGSVVCFLRSANATNEIAVAKEVQRIILILLAYRGDIK